MVRSLSFNGRKSRAHEDPEVLLKRKSALQATRDVDNGDVASGDLSVVESERHVTYLYFASVSPLHCRNVAAKCIESAATLTVLTDVLQASFLPYQTLGNENILMKVDREFNVMTASYDRPIDAKQRFQPCKFVKLHICLVSRRRNIPIAGPHFRIHFTVCVDARSRMTALHW